MLADFKILTPPRAREERAGGSKRGQRTRNSDRERSPQASAATPANTQKPAKKANRERLAFVNWRWGDSGHQTLYISALVVVRNAAGGDAVRVGGGDGGAGRGAVGKGFERARIHGTTVPGWSSFLGPVNTSMVVVTEAIVFARPGSASAV